MQISFHANGRPTSPYLAAQTQYCRTSSAASLGLSCKVAYKSRTLLRASLRGAGRGGLEGAETWLCAPWKEGKTLTLPDGMQRTGLLM